MNVKETYVVLSNNKLMPCVGYGTWQLSEQEAYECVLKALKIGYKHIDTAFAYENEESVGKAIKDSGLDRDKLFITSKLPSHIKTYDEAIKYFYMSLKNMQLDYLDLYLIHAPWPWSDIGSDHTQGNIQVWKAFIDLYNQGLIKAIGVSNFHVKDLKAIIEATNFIPHVNQIRYFVGNKQDEIYQYCIDNKIAVQAYSPLATGELVNHPLLKQLSKKYNVTIPQICLKYCLQTSATPITRSRNEERMESNLDLNFTLDDEDLGYLDSLKYIATRKFMRD